MGCEIGTHTYDHAWLDQLSASEIKKRNSKRFGCHRQIHWRSADSDASTRWMCVNGTVKSNVGLPMILWSVDTRDWETRSTPTTISRVVNGAYDGAIILVHDLHQSTAIASKTFIPKLIANGYQLVTVSEMAELRGIKMKAGQMYYFFLNNCKIANHPYRFSCFGRFAIIFYPFSCFELAGHHFIRFPVLADSQLSFYAIVCACPNNQACAKQGNRTDCFSIKNGNKGWI